jgi:methyltransferase family protein
LMSGVVERGCRGTSCPSVPKLGRASLVLNPTPNAAAAADALQRSLRSRFRARLSRSVRLLKEGRENMSNDTIPYYPGKELEAMSFAVNYHRWIIDEFEPYLGKTVAEVGAGIGSVSKLLLGKRIERLFAFEPSHNMYPLLEKELRQEERARAVNDFFSPRYTQEGFDSVVYINVLEHIQEDRTELTNALEALQSMGHLLLFVPALTWLYSDVDKQMGHFRRYTKKALSGLVEDVGFTLVQARYFDLAGIIPWYVNFVLLRNSFGSGSVSLYDTLAVPPMRLIESVVPPPIGKNVLLIGKKA